METKYNFKSAICTSIEQSERLLALGLKKETADMIYVEVHCTDGSVEWDASPIMEGLTALDFEDNWPPAWSLHRLIEMADTTTYINEGREDEHELWFCMDKCYCWNNHESFYSTNLYDSLINCIEWLIKEGYFPKEYLEDKK